MQNSNSSKENSIKTVEAGQKSAETDAPENELDRVDITSRVLNLVLDMSTDDHLELLKKMDKTSFKGVRRHARKKINGSWKVIIQEGSGALSEGHIKDISGKGMFIRTKKTFLDRQKIYLRFKVPNHPKTLKIIGEVIRLEKHGVGVKFIGKLQKNCDNQSDYSGESKVISIRNYL